MPREHARSANGEARVWRERRRSVRLRRSLKVFRAGPNELDTSPVPGKNPAAAFPPDLPIIL